MNFLQAAHGHSDCGTVAPLPLYFAAVNIKMSASFASLYVYIELFNQYLTPFVTKQNQQKTEKTSLVSHR